MPPQSPPPLQRQNPQPSLPTPSITGDGARTLVVCTGTTITYHSCNEILSYPFDPLASPHQDDEDSFPWDDTSDASNDSNERAPLSTQPRPLEWDIPSHSSPATSRDNDDCAMEQFLCFVHRGTPVRPSSQRTLFPSQIHMFQIWLRIAVVIDERGLPDHP